MAYRFLEGTIGEEQNMVSCGDNSDIQNLFGASGGTVMAWIYADTYGHGDFGRIFDKDGTTNHGWLFYVSNTPRLGFNHAHDFTEGIWVSATGSIGLNQWHHVVVTWDGTLLFPNEVEPTFYVDGVLSATTETQAPVGDPDDDSGARLFIGGRPSDDRQFDGLIADARIYNRLLDASEIQEIFESEGEDTIVDSLVRRFPLSPSKPALADNIPYRDSLENTVDDATSITLTVPDHVDTEDTLVMVVCAGGINNSTPPNITTPSGWTQRMHVDLPVTATSPVVAVYTRTASSEPANYTVSDDQAAHPWGGCIISCPGMTATPTDTSSSTGTSASPSSPSVTPGGNAVLFRIACMDNDVQLPADPKFDFAPDDIRVLHVMSSSSVDENGYVLGVGMESRDGAASGTRVWSGGGSDQWAALTVSFLHGDGIEGLPAKDISQAQVHGETWGRIRGDSDILNIEGG